MRLLKEEVFSTLVDRVCKVKYDSLQVCSKKFRHFCWWFFVLDNFKFFHGYDPDMFFPDVRLFFFATVPPTT